MAALSGLDALIFTAGIGENSSFIRKLVCDKLSYLGLILDEHLNRGGEALREISSSSSKVRALVVPTNEELMIAEDTYSLIVDADILDTAA